MEPTPENTPGQPNLSDLPKGTQAENVAQGVQQPAKPLKMPRNRHEGRSPLLSAIILSTVGTLFLLSWPLMHFLIWPACAAVIASFVMGLSVMLPFMLIFFEVKPEDVFGSIFNEILQSFSEYDVVLFILMGVGAVMLIVAGVQFYKYYKANGTLKVPAKNTAASNEVMQRQNGAPSVAPVVSVPTVVSVNEQAVPANELIAASSTQPEETVDLGNLGYYFLGLLLPMIGLIFAACWRKSNPISSKQCMTGALMFLLIPFVFVVLHFVNAGDMEGTIIALVLMAALAVPVIRGFMKIKKMKAEIMAKYATPEQE